MKPATVSRGFSRHQSRWCDTTGVSTIEWHQVIHLAAIRATAVALKLNRLGDVRVEYPREIVGQTKSAFCLS